MRSFKDMMLTLKQDHFRRTTKAVRFTLWHLGFKEVPANLVDMVLHRNESDEYLVAACLAIAQIGE